VEVSPALEAKVRKSLEAISRFPLLEIKGVSKSFGGTKALNDVSFCVKAGEIVALLGENGAGKSTLIKILAGVYRSESGELLFRGERADPSAWQGSVAFIHQDLALIDWMTVAENMMLAMGYPRRFGLIDWSYGERRAQEALAIVGGGISPESRIGDLSRTEKSLVAIARALATNARLIVLDEPTASLPQSEVETLHAVLRALRAKGVGMIYVSHRLDEVYAISDRVVVLRDGKLVGDRPTADVAPDELVCLIVGRNPESIFVRHTPRDDAAEVLAISGLTVGDVGPITLSVRHGEVVGLFGLRGAGQEIVGRAIFGVEAIDGGSMRLGDQPYAPTDPRTAIASGVLMLAGDRNADSLASGMTVRENLFVNPVAAGRSLLGLRTAGSEAAETSRIGARYGVRPNDPDAPIETLSGGNQQKVIMARWMRINGKLLVLEDPTAGVDVGAKAEIYALLNEALANDLAVVLVSTDIQEVSSICHRALVFRDGQLAEELSGEGLDTANLLRAASLPLCSAGHNDQTSANAAEAERQ
jgi:ribose transport system ATP-binding protein